MVSKTTTEKIVLLMNKPELIRNIGTCAHIDHGKTTLSDSLLAGAGIISEELAGRVLYLDFDEQESARGITINAANVSMIHEVDGKEFLINLIDTPGHVDFGGDVTRAMRAIDGAILLVDAVEGVMPQTETVIRQALREGVRPVLFINKVDRFIRELKLTPEKMQERFMQIMADVNQLIRSIAPTQFKEAWQVSVSAGSIAFGSAFHKWAVSIPYMQKNNITFKDIIAAYDTEDAWKKLCAKAPVHKVILDMVTRVLPNPVQAQKYRVPIIWHGDVESDIGKSLINCDPNGKPVFVVTKVTIDPQAGEVYTGRLFSGKIEKGMDVFLNKSKTLAKIQQVSVYKGAHRILIEDGIAGNILGVTGLKNAYSGETVSIEEMEPFEAITHLFEPVVTKAIEVKNPQDLPKLVDALKDIEKQDATIQIEINEETGENLIRGLGELHLEIWEYRLRHDKKLDIIMSPPIVVYRETVRAKYGPIEGKSPNKHNKLYVTVEPLTLTVAQAIREHKIPELKMKKVKKEVVEALAEAGMDKNEAKQVVDIYKGNVLVEATKGIVHIQEILEMVIEGFEELIRSGPLSKEPCYGLKVTLNDARLHEDSIHRGPGQMIPCVRQAIMNAMILGGLVIYEPVQTIRIDAPIDYLGSVTSLVSGMRGQILDTNQEGEHMIVKARTPVGEMFGFTSNLRSATSGRGSSSLLDKSFEKLPTELQNDVVSKIRKRKGLPAELPKAQLD